jgi:hypothetical protein
LNYTPALYRWQIHSSGDKLVDFSLQHFRRLELKQKTWKIITSSRHGVECVDAQFWQTNNVLTHIHLHMYTFYIKTLSNC